MLYAVAVHYIVVVVMDVVCAVALVVVGSAEGGYIEVVVSFCVCFEVVAAVVVEVVVTLADVAARAPFSVAIVIVAV